MDYKGQRVLCDEDDLRIIDGYNGGFEVGYYGAGGWFVVLDTAETENEAWKIWELIYDTLMEENNTYYKNTDDWCEECRQHVEDCICNND